MLQFLASPSGRQGASGAAQGDEGGAGCAEGSGSDSGTSASASASASAGSALLHAEAGSAAAVEVLEQALRIGGLAQGAFLAVPLARPLLRLARVPALAEVHRLRREWLAALGGGGSGSGAALAGITDLAGGTRAFVLHVNAALRS